MQMRCRNVGSRPEQVVQPGEVVASAANGFVLDYANLTLMEVWDLLATMEQPQRPHCFAMVEAIWLDSTSMLLGGDCEV